MHVSATLLIWGLFLFFLPTLCYTEAGLRRGTKVINFDHHLGACEQGQADASHWGIELVLHNGDGAQPFWWKPVFSIGSLICFSALSSTVPGTVPASLDRGSASHVFIDRCLRVLRYFLFHRNVVPLFPPGEITSWKNIWRLPLVQIAGLDFQRACDMWAATLLSFLCFLSQFVGWAQSVSNAGCLSFSLSFLPRDLEHDYLTVFWIPQVGLE